MNLIVAQATIMALNSDEICMAIGNADPEENDIEKSTGLDLAQHEKEWLADLEQSCIQLETSVPMTAIQVMEIMRDFGNIRINRIAANGFWCNFIELAEGEVVDDLIQ